MPYVEAERAVLERTVLSRYICPMSPVNSCVATVEFCSAILDSRRPYIHWIGVNVSVSRLGLDLTTAPAPIERKLWVIAFPV